MRICIVVFPGGNIGRHNEVAIRRGSTVYNAKIRFFELANSFKMNVHCPFLLSGKLSYSPGAPLTYFNDGGGGGGGPGDFFGSEILAKSDFLGSMKDAGIFWVREKKQRDFFGCVRLTKGFSWVC